MQALPIKIRPALAVLLLLGAASAQASLADQGNGTVYDSDLHVVWTQDFNLFQTQAAANPNLVADIISSVDGQVSDASGTYFLNGTEFDAAAGTLNWYGAQAWVSYLNSSDYAGRQNWRLPAATLSGNSELSYDGSTDVGYNNSAGELGHVFYSELGNRGFYATDGTAQAAYGLVNAGPFLHATSTVLWTGAEAGADAAWYFAALDGKQDNFDKTAAYRAAAVAPVPIPAAGWLLASALGGLAGFGRRKRKTGV